MAWKEKDMAGRAQVAVGTFINLGVPQFLYLYNENALVCKDRHNSLSQAGWLGQQKFVFSQFWVQDQGFGRSDFFPGLCC